MLVHRCRQRHINLLRLDDGLDGVLNPGHSRGVRLSKRMAAPFRLIPPFFLYHRPSFIIVFLKIPQLSFLFASFTDSVVIQVT